jgi:hypothetical protein
MSDALKSLFEGAGGARGEAAYVVVEYDKNGEPAKISGLPDFAAECVAAAVAAAREEGVKAALFEAAAISEKQAQEIVDMSAPASAVNALRWTAKQIRALASDPAALERIINGGRE